MGQTASGRFVLRVRPETHRRLRARAAREGISLNSLCARMVEDGLRASAGPAAGGALDLPVPPGLLGSIAGAWKDRIVGIAAFGSWVRGEAGEGSDLDLLIVLDTGSPIGRGLYDRWEEIRGSGPTPEAGAVSPQFVALPPGPEKAGGLWFEVAREGRVLYDREGELTRFLSALRDFMMAGRVVRRTAHGQPYWVREEPGQ